MFRVRNSRTQKMSFIFVGKVNINLLVTVYVSERGMSSELTGICHT